MSTCEHLPGDAASRGLSRREWLSGGALGFASVALEALLARTSGAAPLPSDGRPPLAVPGSLNPLAQRLPHFRPRAKRVIFLFMHGGPSQVDTFDWKPLLERDHGKPLPFPKPRVVFAPTGNLLRSPWKFRPHGACGATVSELFPELAKHVDKLCFVKSLHGTNEAHGGALLALHTGSDTFVRPSMGSWITYGLGSENENLPGFLTICPTLGHGGVNNWSSAFLPGAYQGTPIGNASVPAERATIEHLKNAELSPELQRRQLDFVQRRNQQHLAERGADDALESRILSFELAYRMQTEAPELLSIDGESVATRELYGLSDPKTANFGRQCLMARRFIEAGVRFVQCTHSYKWDQHEDLKNGHESNAREVDRPIAALLHDLDVRGLLEETLVLWGGEFGRTPVAQGTNGRDHNPHGFTVWMAGGGVRRGFSYGATDEYGYYAVEDKVHVHDLHATLLALLGLDHERLTYRASGRDFRLTDVAGRVITPLFA
ncbi:MAG: DUF1501 domain-containing protein [Planctomycetes bacterium]|nr:DUF1501 domain-containing protein [Planctomycetota bacterium]